MQIPCSIICKGAGYCFYLKTAYNCHVWDYYWDSVSFMRFYSSAPLTKNT